ncbi:MAG: hypothetical protein V4671_09680 [Armatimonadota bacterium]
MIQTAEAVRIAEAGALAMHESGIHSCQPFSGETYSVTKPGQEVPYYVSAAAKSCTCEFFWTNNTCEHILWLEGEIDWVNRLEAEAAERDRYDM